VFVKKKLVRFGVSIEEELLAAFDRLIAEWESPSRSKAIADLVRAELVRRTIESGKDVVGTITVLYDHHEADVTRALTEFQHSYLGVILTNVHIHLDRHNCLEVIIARSSARRLRRVAQKIMHMKGVKHGAISFTSTRLETG
jgi:CopG family nickel-responsive transcriptional regulator